MKTIVKKTLTVLFLCSTFLTMAQVKFNADTDNSVLNWKGFKPTGDHYGTVTIKKGFFTVKDEQVVSGEFEIDMTSIIDLDMDADSEYNTKLVNHLKSEDFFSAELHSHQHAHFKCTSCASVICLDELPSERDWSLPIGYQFQEIELTVKGLCAKCV